MFKKIEYNDLSSERIDKFIHALYPDVSRRFFQIAIKEKQILVNERPISPSYKLKARDQIKINIKKEPNPEIKVLPEKNIKLEILFENSDFSIINKPAGISVHLSTNETSGTLVNDLLRVFPETEKIGEDHLRPGIVHRLDKETSGILIITKTQEAFEYFKNLFKDRKIQKTYLAWSWGILKNKSGEIKDFTGKSSQNPTKQAVSHNPDKLINPKESLTRYKVIQEQNARSLIELKPKTGRKHQLRLHLHSIGHPILGDKKYFNKNVKKANQKFKQHLLHAQKIEFEYLDQKKYTFEAPLPTYFNLQ